MRELQLILMTEEQFLKDVLSKSTQHKCFYHFTDERNVTSIAQHGILATAELRRRKIEIVAMAGNEWSQDADKLFGMDEYVHLCFTKSHPLAHRATQDGRIQNCVYLSIDPKIILEAGVLAVTGVANASGAKKKPFINTLPELDLEVLYTRTKWQDPVIKERLKKAEKCEILVPKYVAVNFIVRGL